MEVIIAKDYDQMSQLAAEIIAGQVHRKPNSVLGLATGGTPIGTYKALVKMYKDGKIDFAKCTSFNLDEYIGIPNDHAERYYNFMWSNLFQHINIPKDRIHVPTNILEGAAEFCAWYEAEIERYGGVDVQLLGIGPDGHIAFNEPTSSLASRTRLKTLDESTIIANARFFKSEADVPRLCDYDGRRNGPRGQEAPPHRQRQEKSRHLQGLHRRTGHLNGHRLRPATAPRRSGHSRRGSRFRAREKRLLQMGLQK